MSYPTIRHYLSTTQYHQILEGGPNPSLDTWINLHYVLRGCHKSLPNSVLPSCLPITPAILCFQHSCWSSHADDYKTFCTWAACWVAFFCIPATPWQSYSRSVLSLGNVAFNSREDPSVAYLTLCQNKTDMLSTWSTPEIHCVQYLPFSHILPCGPRPQAHCFCSDPDSP